MTLNLHNGCKDKIKNKLAEKLPAIQIANKKFINRESTSGLLSVNEALPEHGPIIDNLNFYISEWPLYDFLYGYLSKELDEQQKYDSKTELQSITDIDEYSDIDATSDRLIDLFDSLPWKYRFSLDIKSSLDPFFSDKTEFNITENLRIIRADETFIEQHPLSVTESGNSVGIVSLAMLGRNLPSGWKTDSLYIQVDAEGFIGKYVSTQTTENAVTTIKAFCGLSVALRLLKVEHTYHPATPKLNLIIHKNTSGNWNFDEAEDLNDDISRSISDLTFNDLDGDLESDTQKYSWIERKLNDISVVFNESRKAEKIILAGQWFFESYTGSNELLSFVQTMVALEILLGDKASSDMVGLGELLRNRCAYLIGKTHDQRKNILHDFKKIYEIRSKIVHRGKSKLDLNERSLFRKLQWICRRVIQEEIILLQANT